MKSLFYILFLVFAIQLNNLTGQTINTEKNVGQLFLSDFEHFCNVGISLLESPSSFSKNDWYTAAAFAGGTALLFTIDENVKTFALSNQNQLNNHIFNFDNYYGSGYTTIFTASIYGYGLLFSNDKVRKLGLNTSEALIYSAAITGILKVIIGRRRPFAGDNHLFFKPFQFQNDTYQSLPSGHTTVAFAVSTVMAKYLENVYWKIFWYGSAGMVGLSRIYHNKHWTSDVFMGAAIGYFVGEFVVNFDKKEMEVLGMELNPYINFDRIGFTLSF